MATKVKQYEKLTRAAKIMHKIFEIVLQKIFGIYEQIYEFK